MMTNLFSVFDPASSFVSIAWIIVIMSTTLLTPVIWKIPHSFVILKMSGISTLHKEISFTFSKSNKSQEISVLVIFISILTLNFVALYPQLFSASSHLAITLPLSLIMWSTIMLFGWLKNTNHMLSHLVPQGTPAALMSFMVLIEMVSNLIRPITLCVRLTANLIAGHLLMTLLGNALMSIPILIYPLAMSAPLILTVLESAVAGIQAYVFMTLVTLYITEVK